MDYQRYHRRKFADWKKRVKSRIPALVAEFYAVKYRPAHDHIRLGQTIQMVNSAGYGVCQDLTTEMADQIVLEMIVCELFKAVYGTRKKS